MAGETSSPSVLSGCDEQVPLLSVTRQFDFGQFVTLFHQEDSDPVPLPVVVTKGGELAKSQQKATVRRTYPVATLDGSMPEIVERRPQTADLFSVMGRPPSSPPIVIEVDDVPAFLTTGSVEQNDRIYSVEVDSDVEAGLSAGNSLLVAAKEGDGEQHVLRDVLLIPRAATVDLSATALNELLAGNAMRLDAPKRQAVLTKALIAELLSGRPVITRAIGADRRAGPVHLKPLAVVNRPAGTELRIVDLPAFLAKPSVPGTTGEAIPFQLSPTQIDELRGKGQTDVVVAGVTVRVVVMAVSRQALTGGPGETGGSRPLEKDDTGAESGEAADASTAPAGQGLELTEGFVVIVPEFVLVRLESGSSNPQTPSTSTQPSGGLSDFAVPRLPLGRGMRVALFVPWRQTWSLMGFSRGTLLSSLALAPGEEVTIEVHSWERRARGLEQSTETETEQTLESNQTTRDTEDVFSEMKNNQEFTWQVSGGIDASYSNGVVTVNARAAASVENASRVENVARTARNHLSETTTKAAARVRSRRVTRINESIETGREDRVTRRIRNPNQCRTVTYDFFETLAHYEIELAFRKQRMRLVAMLRNPFDYDFTPELVRRNETGLRNALIDPALASGFDALRLQRSYQNAIDILGEQGKLRKTDEEASRADRNEREAEPKPPSPQETAVIEILTSLKTALVFLHGNASYQAAINKIDANDPTYRPVTEKERQDFKRWLFIQLCATKLPTVLSTLDAIRQTTGSFKATDARALVAELPGPGRTPTLAGLGDLSDYEKEQAGLASARCRARASCGSLISRLRAGRTRPSAKRCSGKRSTSLIRSRME